MWQKAHSKACRWVVDVRKNDDKLESALQKAVQNVKKNGTCRKISKIRFGTDKSKE